MYFGLCGKQKCICLLISLHLVQNRHSSILDAGHCMAKEHVIVIFTIYVSLSFHYMRIME